MKYKVQKGPPQVTHSNVLENLTSNEEALLGLWNSLRADRPMPSRDDLQTEDLFNWIGWLHLLIPVDNGADFRYEVFGTEELPREDPDMTGRCVSEWHDDRANRAEVFYGAAFAQKRPVYSCLPDRNDSDWLLISRLCLPLGNENGVDHLLCLLTRRDSSVPPTSLIVFPV